MATPGCVLQSPPPFSHGYGLQAMRNDEGQNIDLYIPRKWYVRARRARRALVSSDPS
jgi:hypothetical protein